MKMDNTYRFLRTSAKLSKNSSAPSPVAKLAFQAFVVVVVEGSSSLGSSPVLSSGRGASGSKLRLRISASKGADGEGVGAEPTRSDLLNKK